MSQVPLIEAKWALIAPGSAELDPLALGHAMAGPRAGEERPNHAGPREMERRIGWIESDALIRMLSPLVAPGRITIRARV